MTINETIQGYKAAKLVADMIQRLPNSQYDPAKHYAAINCANRWANIMINHPDWTPQLQDEHYPNGVGDVAYPVSC